jgi:hypothetical protein
MNAKRMIPPWFVDLVNAPRSREQRSKNQAAHLDRVRRRKSNGTQTGLTGLKGELVGLLVKIPTFNAPPVEFCADPAVIFRFTKAYRACSSR